MCAVESHRTQAHAATDFSRLNYERLDHIRAHAERPRNSRNATSLVIEPRHCGLKQSDSAVLDRRHSRHITGRNFRGRGKWAGRNDQGRLFERCALNATWPSTTLIFEFSTAYALALSTLARRVLIISLGNRGASHASRLLPNFFQWRTLNEHSSALRPHSDPACGSRS